jgi:hypothetical protein
MVLICFDSSPYVSHSYPDEISPYVERLNPHAPLGWHWNARKPGGFNPHLFGSLTFTNNWCRYIIYIQCNIYIYIYIYIYIILYIILYLSIHIYCICVCVATFFRCPTRTQAWGPEAGDLPIHDPCGRRGSRLGISQTIGDPTFQNYHLVMTSMFFWMFYSGFYLKQP